MSGGNNKRRIPIRPEDVITKEDITFLIKRMHACVIRKRELYEEISEEEREAEAEAREIVAIREVPQEEVEELVKQGWKVERVYKGVVTVVKRRGELPEEEEL